MRKLAVVVVILVLLLATLLAVLATPDTDAQAMRLKYGGSAPTFATTPGGMNVHYRDQGCRSCPAILLVHGSNSSLQTWEPLVERLGDRYRLLSYDQPGHGLTGPHPRDDYTAKGLFEAIAAVREAAGVDRFVIAGNSMGGWVAWRYALARPQDVLALILINSSGAPPTPDAEKAKLYLGARIMRYSIGRFLAQYITPRSVIERSVKDNLADAGQVTEAMVDRYWELLRYPGNRRAAGLRAIADRELENSERLGELLLPTMVLWGDEDLVIPPHNAQTLHSLIRNSELLILEGVGHAAMEEAPDRSAAGIGAFLRANGLESSAAEVPALRAPGQGAQLLLLTGRIHARRGAPDPGPGSLRHR